MKHLTVTASLSAVVSITGIVVMAGWVFDIPVLKSILPHWVTMKFSTALCFFLSGMILWLLSSLLKKQSDVVQVLLPAPSFVILMVMGLLLASSFLGIRSGIEDLFVKESVGAVMTTTPGRPSAGTMVCFVLIGFSGLGSVFRLHTQVPWIFKGVGTVITVLACLALLGYAFSWPVLYYSVEGWSTAMAFHTALLFLMLGIGFRRLAFLEAGV